MPFKSKAQRRKFAQLLVEGKITDEQYEEWNRSTGTQTLPERVGAKRTTKKAAAEKKAPTRTKAPVRKSSSARNTKRPARKAAAKRPARRKTSK
jgi:hypothetical protein